MSEIEKAAKLNRNVFIVYFLFLLITVFLTAWFFVTSNKYQDAIKADADSKIEAAKAEAAKANENVAALTVRAEEARVSILKMEKEVADAQRKQAEAQRSLEELRGRIKPRLLTREQQTQFVELLKDAKGTITIDAMLGDSESVAFASQINALLISAGWKSLGVMKAVYGGQPKGLIILVHSAEKAPPYALKLQQTLTLLGFPAPAELHPDLPEASVKLIVGTKP